jgi:hypothetical protein
VRKLHNSKRVSLFEANLKKRHFFHQRSSKFYFKNNYIEPNGLRKKTSLLVHPHIAIYRLVQFLLLLCRASVVEPEPQGAETFS